MPRHRKHRGSDAPVRASGVSGETIEAPAWNAEHGIAMEGSMAAVDGWGWRLGGRLRPAV